MRTRFQLQRSIRRALISNRLPLFFICAILLCALPGFAQLSRDPAAVNAMTAAITRMGGIPPLDSVAIGDAVLITGDTHERGTVRILTKSLSRTAELYEVPSGSKSHAYLDGIATEKNSAKSSELSFEAALSSQSVLFPLPWMAAMFSSDDVTLESLGSQSQKEAVANHFRWRKTFASEPLLQEHAEFTTREVWLDASSSLPLRISWEYREAGGATPAIPMAVEYSDYRNVQGFLYPFHIRKLVNGVLWADIIIQSVTFNSGVSDAEFLLK